MGQALVGMGHVGPGRATFGWPRPGMGHAIADGSVRFEWDCIFNFWVMDVDAAWVVRNVESEAGES
jgi:hypothetical protein